MIALVRAIHSRFYPLGRQVARFDLQLTYFSKWAEFPILVLLTIFGESTGESGLVYEVDSGW